MSNTVIAFLVAIGVSAWFYSKLMKTTGGNRQSSVIAVAVLFIILFMIARFLLDFITHFSGK